MAESVARPSAKGFPTKSPLKEYKNSKPRRGEEKPVEFWKAKTSCFRKSQNTEGSGQETKDIRLVEVKNRNGVPYTLMVDVFWQTTVDKKMPNVKSDKNTKTVVFSDVDQPSVTDLSNVSPMNITDMWPEQVKLFDGRMTEQTCNPIDNLCPQVKDVDSECQTQWPETVDVGVGVNMSDLQINRGKEGECDVLYTIQNSNYLSSENEAAYYNHTQSYNHQVAQENINSSKEVRLTSHETSKPLKDKNQTIKPCMIKLNYKLKRLTKLQTPEEIKQSTKDQRPKEARKWLSGRLKSVDPQARSKLYTIAAGWQSKAFTKNRSHSIKSAGKGEPEDSSYNIKYREVFSVSKSNLLEGGEQVHQSEDSKNTSDTCEGECSDEGSLIKPIEIPILQMETEYDKRLSSEYESDDKYVTPKFNQDQVSNELNIESEKEATTTEDDSTTSPAEQDSSSEKEATVEVVVIPVGKKTTKNVHVKWKRESSRVSCLGVRVPKWKSNKHNPPRSSHSGQLTKLGHNIPAFKTRSPKVSLPKGSYCGWR